MDQEQTEAKDIDRPRETIGIKIILVVITAIGAIVAAAVSGVFALAAAKITAGAAKITASPPAGANQTSDPAGQASGGASSPASSHYRLKIGRISATGPDITAVDLDHNKVGSADAPPAGADLVELAGRLKPQSGSIYRDSSSADRCRDALGGDEGGVGLLDVGDLDKGYVICLWTDEDRAAMLTVMRPTQNPHKRPLILDVRIEE
jgi:hypothetical protein